MAVKDNEELPGLLMLMLTSEYLLLGDWRMRSIVV